VYNKESLIHIIM